jgi:thiol-disulfide isomerase/thioredoxin
MMSTPTPVDPTTYIKEMEDSEKDWEAAMANTERPILIQAGASWCGPCQMLKPTLLELVKSYNGAVEYLYVDVDKHGELA